MKSHKQNQTSILFSLLAFLIFITAANFNKLEAQITYDGNGASAFTINSGVINLPFTVPAGTDRLLAISVCVNGSLTSVDFNGINATLAVEEILVSFGSVLSSIYYIPLGSGGAISSSINITGIGYMVVGGGSFQNIDQNNPLGSTMSTDSDVTGWSTVFSLDVPSNEGNLVYDKIFVGFEDANPDVSQTLVFDEILGSGTASSFKIATSGMTNMTYTSPFNQPYTYSAAEFNESPNKYVLVATDGDLEFDESIAHSGGIGIMSDDEAEIEDNAQVTAPGTFVKAPEIDVDNTSNVSVLIYEPADPVLPMFRYNNMDGGDDVDVDDGETVTLMGGVYDDIEVGDDATIIFSGNSDVYIDDLDTDDNVTILFDQCTNLMLSGKMKLGKDNNFNPDQMDVTVFAEDKIEIKKRANIYSTMYSMDKFETKKSSSGSTSKLHGMFIGEEVEANEHGEYWYQAFNADCGGPPPMIEHPVVDTPNDSTIPEEVEEVEETELIEEETTEEAQVFNEYRLYPNPTANNIFLAAKKELSGAATFRITDVRGNLVLEQSYPNLRTPKMNFDVSNLPSGIYILYVQVENSAPVAKKFVVEK